MEKITLSEFLLKNKTANIHKNLVINVNDRDIISCEYITGNVSKILLLVTSEIYNNRDYYVTIDEKKVTIYILC